MKKYLADPNCHSVDISQPYKPCFFTEVLNKSICSVVEPGAHSDHGKSMIDPDLQLKNVIFKFPGTHHFSSIEITETISIKDPVLKLKDINSKLADSRLSKRDRNKLEQAKAAFEEFMKFCEFQSFSCEERNLFFLLMVDITERFIDIKKGIIEKWGEYVAKWELYTFYIRLNNVKKLFFCEQAQARRILKRFKQKLATITSVSVGLPKKKQGTAMIYHSPF